MSTVIELPLSLQYKYKVDSNVKYINYKIYDLKIVMYAIPIAILCIVNPIFLLLYF